MLRVQVVQEVNNRRDLHMEEVLLEIPSLWYINGMQLARVPAQTTILRFRQLLNTHIV